MSDNPSYNLARRIEAARAEADTSLDPFVHMVKNALQGVADAEIHWISREAHNAAHPAPDPESFPRWSEISKPGELDYGPYCPPEATGEPT